IDPLGLQVAPTGGPLAEAYHNAAELIDQVFDRKDRQDEFHRWVDWEDKVNDRLREVGKQFECDTWVMVCYRLSHRNAFMVYTTNYLPNGYICERRLAPGRRGNCCKP